MVSGRNIMPSNALSNVGQTDLAPLITALKAAVDGSNQDNILVQTDRRVQYSNLSQVLRACAQAGLNDVSLVVQGGES